MVNLIVKIFLLTNNKSATQSATHKNLLPPFLPPPQKKTKTSITVDFFVPVDRWSEWIKEWIYGAHSDSYVLANKKKQKNKNKLKNACTTILQQKLLENPVIT